MKNLLNNHIANIANKGVTNTSRKTKLSLPIGHFDIEILTVNFFVIINPSHRRKKLWVLTK